MSTSSSPIWLRAGLSVVVAASLCLAAGCKGGSKKEARVVGKVTLDGQPLGGGNVILQATGEHAQQFKSSIRPDGTYDLVAVPPGEYFVGVETESIKGMAAGMYGNQPKGAPNVQQPQMEGMPKYVEIPKKYADPKTSGLPKMTIQQGNKEPQNIQLTKS